MAFNFEEFQKVVESANQADGIKSELKRTLKKVSSSLDHLQGLLAEMETVLSDEYVATPKERKVRQPHDRALVDPATGKPKKLGRPKKNQASTPE